MYPVPPLEDQYLQIDGEYYRIEEREELAFGKTTVWSAITTDTLSSFEEVDAIEPHELAPPRMRIYWYKASVDKGKLYIQVLRGKARRGTRRKPSPSSSEPLIGDVDQAENPEYNPTLGGILLNREIPAFAVYNPYGHSITPRLTIRGMKMTVVNLRQIESSESFPNVEQILTGLENGTIKHSRLTKLGLAEE